MISIRTFKRGKYFLERFIKACRLTLVSTAISFVGWCFEKVGRYVVYGAIGDRGFLHLPICPIYGICTLLIYLLCGTPRKLSGLMGVLIDRVLVKIKKARHKRLAVYLLYFVFVTVLSTLAELVTGLALRPFGVMLWDYSERAFNFLGIICVGFSLTWGALITLFMDIAYLPLLRIARRIPTRICIPLATLSGALAAADFLLCILLLFV